MYHNLLLQQLEVVDRLQDQLTGLREEHCSVLQSLKDAHQLIERHVETANKATNKEVEYKSIKSHHTVTVITLVLL